jgi:diaminohydroxyphosphoribosylaminopyrimidine deaminase / 5-amino-6-(5-phosphoribosylamino)uracil reductase
MTSMRPKVLCNMAPSLDGKIAPTHRVGPFVMSRGPEDSKRMHALRARADAVIIGTSNLAADDPDLMPGRLRVVVTRAGERVKPTAKMFDPALGGEAVVAHAASMPESQRAALRERATLVELGASDVDVSRLLEWLASERGCRVALCEGGGVLNAHFFDARAVDELYLTIVPRVLGGAHAPTLVAGDGFQPGTLPDARLTQVERVGDELFLVYAFDWKT